MPAVTPEIFDRICERLAGIDTVDGGPCIYALCDNETGEVRYIGKANDPHKRLASHMRDSKRRKTPVYNWIRKNGTPDMKIVAADCADWKSAEVIAIEVARSLGARLLNVATGGDEPFCPQSVRAENGQKNAQTRSKPLWAAYRNLGKSLRWVKSRGDGARTKRLEYAIQTLRRLETSARENGTIDRLEAYLSSTNLGKCDA